MSAPVNWILDTKVVTEMMRTNPDPAVEIFLDRIAPSGIGLSAVTVWEILNGIGRLDQGKRRNSLFYRFNKILDELFADRVIDWTQDHARICASIMEHKRR